jgi:hypothetical protein
MSTRSEIGLTPVIKLSRDIIRALQAGAKIPSMPIGSYPEAAGEPPGPGSDPRCQARILVDLYYTMQELRKRLGNQVGAIDRGVDTGASHEAVDFALDQATQLEVNARLWLETLASGHPMWPWLSAVHGIGPVLASGLLAHLKLMPTVGHWWRFAGYDPSQKWLTGADISDLWNAQTGGIEERVRAVSIIVGRSAETVVRDATHDFKTGQPRKLTRATAIASLARIPFNRPLKTLCWKIGDSFVKLGSREDAFYARWYRQRKAEEAARNERGERSGLAAATLKARPNHAQAEIYKAGKLPDGRVDLMARRATVKLFLSHMHEVWWRLEHGTLPPAPFSVAIQGHAHYIPAPYLEAVGLQPH